MRHLIAWAIAALVITIATPAAAVPDQAFSEQHFKYVEAKRQEFLARIVAKGHTPTPAQSVEATCWAIMWWKMANPGGEAKLTYAALVALRRAEVWCGQKMRRAKPISIEAGNPPATVVRPGSNSDGTQEAYEDFIRWHQVTLTNASTIMDYVAAKVTEWGLFGPGTKLYDDVKKAEDALREAIRTGRNTQSAYHDLDMARLRLANAEAAEAERAAADYARAHPITVANAENIMQYVHSQVFVWGLSEAGSKLYDDVKKAEAAVRDAIAGHGSFQSAAHDLDMARLRLANAEAAEATRAALEYARAHPITLANAASMMEYIRYQVFLWGFSGEGTKLYDELAAAKAALEAALHTQGGNWQSADMAVKVAQARVDAAEAAAAEKAALEYARAHPITANAPSTADYVNSQVFLWGFSDEATKLYDELAAAKAALEGALHYGGNWQSADMAVKVAQARVDAAEAAAAEKAHAEWRAAHPGEPEVWPAPSGRTAGDDYRPTDPRVWSGRGGAGSYPIPFELLPRAQQIEIEAWENRTANGSVDPLDSEASARARQAIVVGANSDVGSGARTRDKAVGTALGIAGGLLGGGGGGRSNGPQVVNCRVGDSEMTAFDDPQTGVQLRVAAQRQGDNILVFADIARSPDQGTFQAAVLDDRNGHWRTPADADICKLHGEWSLSVSWTRTSYVNNQVVSRESGGWSKSGSFELLGAANDQGAPTGMWKQLGFSNASHGARMVRLTYPAPTQQFRNGGMDLIIHVTRPGQDPVSTVPFAMHVTEGREGFSFERLQ